MVEVAYRRASANSTRIDRAAPVNFLTRPIGGHRARPHAPLAGSVPAVSALVGSVLAAFLPRRRTRLRLPVIERGIHAGPRPGSFGALVTPRWGSSCRRRAWSTGRGCGLTTRLALSACGPAEPARLPTRHPVFRPGARLSRVSAAPSSRPILQSSLPLSNAVSRVGCGR